MRDGYVARWQDADYDAVPGVDADVRLYTTAPADGFEEIRPGRYLRVVGAGEVENLRYVRTQCSWRGEPFVVIAEHDGWIRVEYIGGRGPAATALGLEKMDIGVYQAWVPHGEVSDVREVSV